MKSNSHRTLLVIDASPRRERSHSPKLSAEFVSSWEQAHPDGKILTRDLAQNPPPFVSEAWIVGAFAPLESQPVAAREAIAVSDRYVDELLAADDILVATPMFNLSVPRCPESLDRPSGPIWAHVRRYGYWVCWVGQRKTGEGDRHERRGLSSGGTGSRIRFPFALPSRHFRFHWHKRGGVRVRSQPRQRSTTRAVTL